MTEQKLAHLVTFGCQMNEADSELMAGLLEGMGYDCTDDPAQADIILLNTCCVRETAENKVWGLLGKLKRLKRQKPELIIGVSGCMPQQKGVVAEIKRRFPHVDLVLGTYNRHELPDLIGRIRSDRAKVHEVWEEAGALPEGFPVKRQGGIRAWVPVIYGCNNFCTYCIVPHVRGRERSRRPEAVVEDVRKLVEQGYQEVTLLGQNVNSYGKDLGSEMDFAGLLYRLNEIENLWRIRYMTSHPRDFSERLVEAVAACDKVCENFHLPAQAGSNRVLKRMNRGYTREYYLDLVAKIRAMIPDAGISTDLMVGFPGETEEDFAQTVDLVRQVRYDQAFTFVYNPRRGTPAAGMPDQVPDEVKSRRIQELITLQKEIALGQNRALEGSILEVLVEGTAQNDPGLVTGRCRTNKQVTFPGTPELAGRLIQVKIDEGHLAYLAGYQV